jgi:hypothetical protein
MLKQKPNIRLIPNSDTVPIVIQQSDRADQSTPQRTATAKRMPAPDISIMMEQRTWENAQLRKELEYQRRKHGASMYLLEEVKLVVHSLQQALINFQKLNTELEDETTEI